jgi:hypothetical protein
LDQDLIDGAVKLFTQEGYSLEAAANAVHITNTTLRQLCQKRSDQSSPTTDKARVDQLEAEVRQSWAIASATVFHPNSNFKFIGFKAVI